MKNLPALSARKADTPLTPRRSPAPTHIQIESPRKRFVLP